jgi:transposase InsO family protein
VIITNEVTKPTRKKYTTRKNTSSHTNSTETAIIENETLNRDLTSYTDVLANCTLANGKTITAKMFQELQMLDPVIAALVDNKTKGIHIHKGVYVKTIYDNIKILIPENLLRALILLHHYVIPGIHKSQKQILRDIQSIYYYPQPNLSSIIKEQIGNCHICQLFQEGKQNIKMMQLPRFDKARLSWSIDLVTDLPTSNNSYKILLIAVDDFSNYIIAIPLLSTTSSDLIKAIKNHIISPFGIPKVIRSDEQPGIYNSKEFFNFFEQLGIELQATAVASPFSNGRAETTIRIFKHAARKYFHQMQTILQWDEHVPIITSALNSSVNSYGFAPEEIMFGHRLENRFALVDLPQLNDTNTTNNEQAIDAFLNHAAKIRAKYNKLKTLKHQSNATFKNKNAKDKRFEVGDLVLHRQLQVSTGTASKFRPHLTGPYIIQATEGITAICKHLETNRVIKAHFLNLTPYRYDKNSFYPPSQNLSLDLGGDAIN